MTRLEQRGAVAFTCMEIAVPAEHARDARNQLLTVGDERIDRLRSDRVFLRDKDARRRRCWRDL